MPDDRRALQVALRGCAMPPADARIVMIRDTLALDRLWVSPSLRQAVADHPRLTLVDEAPLAFSAEGELVSPWAMAGVPLALAHD
jgi:hypothetical protein